MLYIYALWNLDNGFGKKALGLLLKPTCWKPISMEHWTQIISTLMNYDLLSEAYQFLSLPVPPIKNLTQLDESIKIKIRVYLS